MATQTLSFNGNSILLEQCDFNAEGSAGLEGFQLGFQQEMQTSIAFNIGTHPLLTGYSLDVTSGLMLLEMRWSLLLPLERKRMLSVLVQAHRQAVANKAEPFALRDDNSRLEIEEPGLTRTRAKIGLVSAIGSAGFAFFPRLDVVVTEYNDEIFIPSLQLYAIEMSATEALIVPISEDL